MPHINNLDFDDLYENIKHFKAKNGGYKQILYAIPFLSLRNFHTWQINQGLISFDGNKLNIKQTVSELPFAIVNCINDEWAYGDLLKIDFPEYYPLVLTKDGKK